MILPTKIVVIGSGRGDPERINPDQVPDRFHDWFGKDLTGKTLTFNGFALLVERDETVDQERTLYCKLRVDLLGVELPTVLLLEPLAELGEMLQDKPREG